MGLVNTARLGLFLTKVKELIAAKADKNHSHSYLPLVGGTLTGNVTINRDSSPVVKLGIADTIRETRIYKNATPTADYGTVIADYDSTGGRDLLMLCRANTKPDKLILSVQDSDGNRASYRIYGQHNKPTAADVGALSASGDIDVQGAIRVLGNQAVYDNGTVMMFGTGNRNTTVVCATDGDVNIQGGRIYAPSLVPRANNSFQIGNSSNRYKGIYLTSQPNVSSDERCKRDIRDLPGSKMLDFINRLNVVEYNYTDDPDGTARRIGLIAQEMIASDPEMAKYFVDKDEDGYYSIRPADLVFPLIAAVQELSKR